jgi:hypothetical protein
MSQQNNAIEITGGSVASCRSMYPDAAIIRDHGHGRLTVFPETVDALNHRSATRKHGK